jgi:hypothetical protein
MRLSEGGETSLRVLRAAGGVRFIAISSLAPKDRRVSNGP